MNRVLLTGFEPFKEEEINPSQIVARKMHGRNIGGKKVISSILTVDETCAEKIQREITNVDPSHIVNLGLASGRSGICLEKVAINVMPEKKTEKIVEDGPDAYFSRLPVQRILKELHENNIPSRISYSAGTYFCNYIMYYTLHCTRDIPTKSGFIHIPYTPKQVVTKDKPSMELEMIEKGVEIAVRCL